MKVLTLTLQLKSDATFGRGEGVAGWVDVEVQHDPYGLPFLGGRTLKGILNEECANILYSLGKIGQQDQWRKAAQLLFGNPGSTLGNRSMLHVGDATLPADLRQAVQQSVESGALTRSQVLESLTAVRRQTAVNAESGAPDEHTLRTMRVILRETTVASLREQMICLKPILAILKRRYCQHESALF